MRERGGFAVRLSGVQIPVLSHSSGGTLGRLVSLPESLVPHIHTELW